MQDACNGDVKLTLKKSEFEFKWYNVKLSKHALDS